MSPKKEYKGFSRLRKKVLRAYPQTKILVFDLDGTLAKSKSGLDREMSALLCRLLEKKMMAVISGGNLAQFKKQFLNRLNCRPGRLKNLFILPVSGGSLYSYKIKRWHAVYRRDLTKGEKTKIIQAFKRTFWETGYSSPKRIYGKVIEDRGCQITFSALGQKAPLNKKKEWNLNLDVRPKLQALLRKYLPRFETRLGGLTSIDVTKKGIDKAYGIKQIKKILTITEKEIIYIGDALYKGGNDYLVKQTGVTTLEVKGPEETKRLLKYLLEKSNTANKDDETSK